MKIYKVQPGDTLYSVAAKLYPNKIMYGVDLLNDVNNLYGKDTFLLDKMMDFELYSKELYYIQKCTERLGKNYDTDRNGILRNGYQIFAKNC